MKLTKELIKLGASPKSKEEAILEVALVLENAQKISPEYAQGMLKREGQENTYLGNGVAIPHGTPESRSFIKESAIAVLQVPNGVDWGDGEDAHIVVGIAAGDNEHLAILKRLSLVVGDEEVAEKLAKTTDPNDILEVLSAVATEPKKATTESKASGGSKFIIGITSCPTGVAHTYMAQEALEKAAAELGYEYKIETQGSVGPQNILTEEDVKRADLVIIASDVNPDLGRFNGKKLYRTNTKAPIRDGKGTINTAFEQATVFSGGGQTVSSSTEKKGVYKHLMNGVSHMLPFVVAGGLLIALGFLIGSLTLGSEEGIHIYKDEYKGSLGATVFWTGKAAFALFVPILAGFIGFSIAGRAGLAPAMVGGFISQETGAGFLGAILAGFIAGYLVDWLNKSIKLPKDLEALKPMIILPLIGTGVVGLIMYLVLAGPVASLQSGLENWLMTAQGLEKQGENIVRVREINFMVSAGIGALIGAMMALDMGGPINKAAYATSVALLGSGIKAPMAASMAAGMTPPIAIFVATLIFANRFTEEERQAGKSAAVLGLSFITEGAIPYAAKDPIHVIPALMLGSALCGAICMMFGCASAAPHGGLFVIFAIDNPVMYLIAIAAGTALSAFCLGLFKPKLQ